MNTAADFLSRLEIDPKEKLILQIQEGVTTQPTEVNIQTTGIAQKDQVFFQKEDAELSSKELLWRRKQ